MLGMVTLGMERSLRGLREDEGDETFENMLQVVEGGNGYNYGGKDVAQRYGEGEG